MAILGGSRFQIAGPTGAFVPVLFSIVAQYGYGGLALAAMMAGVMLILVGALKMGRLLEILSLSRGGRIHERHRRDYFLRAIE